MCLVIDIWAILGSPKFDSSPILITLKSEFCLLVSAMFLTPDLPSELSLLAYEIDSDWSTFMLCIFLDPFMFLDGAPIDMNSGLLFEI